MNDLPGGGPLDKKTLRSEDADREDQGRNYKKI
jgi:hypothetical protein